MRTALSEEESYPKKRLRVISIVAAYALFGGLWIILSDRLLSFFIKDAETITRFQTYKGWFYVVITSLLLYLLISLYVKTLQNLILRLKDLVAERDDHLSSLSKEISGREKAENEVFTAQRYWEDTFQAIGHAVTIVDADYNILMVNLAAAMALGDSVEHLKGKKCYQLFHNSELPADSCPLKKLLETGHLELAEIAIEALGGTYLVSCTPIFDEEGRIKKIIHIATDISEKKKIEEALRQSEERYRMLVDNVFFGLFIADPSDGRFLFINQKLHEMCGYSKEEFLSLRAWDIIHPGEHQMLSDRFEEILHAGADTSISKYTCIRKDNSLIRLEISSAPVIHEGKVALQALVNDATQSEELEGRLRQAQKMEAIGTLAGGIAHDFNNILTAIIGYGELAEFHVYNNPKGLQDLKEILKAGNRAKELVKQILAFSRKSEYYELMPIYLHPIIKEVLKLLRASLPATIEIRTSIAEESDAVIADPTQIHQVLMNLCTNAAYAMMEKGGVLEITLSEVETFTDQQLIDPELTPGKYIMLTVSDTGHGIPDEIIGKIFDPYFTTKKKDVGTGMGLAVVQGIVKSYGGRISVFSEKDKGSTFAVYFPCVKRDKSENLEATDDPIPTGHERILFIDDEVALSSLWKKTLESLGYSVETTSISPDALNIFRSQPEDFDIIITDMTMPHLTGADLAMQIRKIRPDIPIILCTGYSSSINENKAKAMGINAFMAKPLTTRELAKRLREVLDSSGLQHG